MFNKYRKQQKEGGNILTELGRAMMMLVKFMFGGSRSRFNREAELRKWNEIEKLLEIGDSAHNAQAVIRGDSFLDAIMKQAGGRGATYADRLRSLEPKFSPDAYQAIWQAHKLRNRIAHDHVEVSNAQANDALRALRRGASQLGAF